MSFWREKVIQPGLDRDVESAVAEQEAVLRRDPKNAPAHFALGTLCQLRSQTERAVEYFFKAIELDPNYSAPRVSLGRIYAVRGDYALAWKLAREAEGLGDRSLLEMLDRYPNLTR